MNAFMDFLNNRFTPAVQKLFKRPWIAAVASAMQKNLPFILTGSMISLYNVIRSYLEFLPDFGVIFSYSFGMLGLITAFMLANQIMEKLKKPQYTVVAGLVSVIIFIMLIKPEIVDGMLSVEFGRLGPSGMVVGMLAGFLTAVIFNLYSKIPWLQDSAIPDFVVGWIHNIIPITLTLGAAAFLSFGLDLDVFNLVLAWFAPVASFGQTLPGFILIMLIPTIFLTLGISTWTFNAVTAPIFLAGIEANILAVAAGAAPMNIVTSETIYTAALLTMGGTGATLCLNLLMLRSKSANLKTMGRICIIPSIFNINEPLVFGTPVIYNPLLMLPMWINSITGTIIVWFSMRLGLLNIPAKFIQVGQIPAPFSSVLITEDLRAIAVWAVLFVVYFVTWYPFFKAYEAKCVEEEAQEAMEAETDNATEGGALNAI